VGRGVLARVGVEALAAEEVYLLQLREQVRARGAAGSALQLVDLEVLVLLQTVGIERVAGVEVSGDDQRVALDFLLARRPQPVGPALLHQLDEFVIPLRQARAEGLLLVGGVDGDGANRLFLGENRRGGERRHGRH
jgi:hypothetical protein